MRYPQEAIREFHIRLPRVLDDLNMVYLESIVFAEQRLANAEAKNFMKHGFGRRIGLIRRSAGSIFGLYPPERTEPLPRETLEELNINLHAFVLHCNAVEDNLAWCYVKEFNLDLNKFDVSLFNARLKRHLPAPIVAHLNNDELINWHTTYSTDFRDGLAHRIPLYVPPSQLTPGEVARTNELQAIFNESMAALDFETLVTTQEEMNRLGTATPCFLHAAGSNQHILHPQVLCDAMTVVELYRIMTQHWAAPVVQ